MGLEVLERKAMRVLRALTKNERKQWCCFGRLRQQAGDRRMYRFDISFPVHAIRRVNFTLILILEHSYKV